MKSRAAIDLFSGCGGMSLGFQNAGFEISDAYDKWRPAIEVYRVNFDHPIHEADLSDPEVQNDIAAKNPEIIFGGPPCQDYSTAGHHDTSRGRAVLTLTYRDIVLKAMPEWFVMENVAAIATSDNFRVVKDSFRKAGYGLTEQVLDASLCGVPQKRTRMFLIGHAGDKDGFLTDALVAGLSDRPMTMRDYFGDKLGIDYYFRVPVNYRRRGIFSVDEPCQTIRGVDRPIPPGYPGHPSDPVPMSEAIRILSVRERASVQTFPEDFQFTGSKTDQNLMIGNAVPVKLAEYVARAIRKCDESFHRKAKKA